MNELYIQDRLHHWGWLCNIRCEHNLNHVDIVFKAPKWANWYTADVKDICSDGMFYIDARPDGWLFNPNRKSDRIWHANSGLKTNALVRSQ